MALDAPANRNCSTTRDFGPWALDFGPLAGKARHRYNLPVMKSSPSLVIVDYGAGNLRSVSKALEKVGYPAVITSDASQVVRADGIIMPGVGASAQAMASLTQLGLVDAVKEVVQAGKPFL